MEIAHQLEELGLFYIYLVLELAQLRIQEVQKYLVEIEDKLPFNILCIGQMAKEFIFFFLLGIEAQPLNAVLVAQVLQFF